MSGDRLPRGRGQTDEWYAGEAVLGLLEAHRVGLELQHIVEAVNKKESTR